MIVSDAADFTDLDGYNYFYFFSPFPADYHEGRNKKYRFVFGQEAQEGW